MSDIGIYRAAEYVGGKITAIVLDSAGSRVAVIALDRDVDVILRAEVNSLPSTRVELAGLRRALILVPPSLAPLVDADIAVTIIAEVAYERLEGDPVPASIGLGLRPSLIDGEAQAVQTAIRSLLMSPGTDVWNPGRGSGLRLLRGRLVNPVDLSVQSRQVHAAIQRFNANVGRLRTTGRSRLEGPNRTARHRVVRITVQSVRVLGRAEAERRFALSSLSTSLRGTRATSFDPTEQVLAIGLLHQVRGPGVDARNVSSAVTV